MTCLQKDGSLDKGLYEVRWASQLAYKTLSHEDYQRWLNYRSVDRVNLNIGSSLAHWEFAEGDAKLLEEFKLAAVEITGVGIRYIIKDSCGNTTPIGHHPKLFFNTGCFVWVPHFNEFRHIPTDWENAQEKGYLRMSLCLRQESNPTKNLQPDHDYLTTRKIFETQWANKTF